jgi:hypothetical protein
MYVLVTLRDDHEKFYTRYSFGELNEISVMERYTCIFFKALVIELGTTRAPTIFDVPALVIMKKPAMGF